jgi:hypothetical protein
MIIPPSTHELDLDYPQLQTFLDSAQQSVLSMRPRRRDGESSTEFGPDSLSSILQQVDKKLGELHTTISNYKDAVKSYAELPYVVGKGALENGINPVKVGRKEFREAMDATTQGLKKLHDSLPALDLPEAVIQPAMRRVDGVLGELQSIQRKEQEKSVDLDHFHAQYASDWYAWQRDEYNRLNKLHEQKLEEQAASSPQQAPQQRFAKPPEHGAGPQARSPQRRPNSKARVRVHTLSKARKLSRRRSP